MTNQTDAPQLYSFRAVSVERGEKFSQLSGIVTVIAASHVDAVAEIERQLTLNPSRRPYFDKWVADGRIITLVS
jgi:hypothetical protein